MNQTPVDKIDPVKLLQADYLEIQQLLDIQTLFLKACVTALLDLPVITAYELDLRKQQVSRLITVLKNAYEYKREIGTIDLVPATPQQIEEFLAYDQLAFFKEWCQKVVSIGEGVGIRV